MPRPHRERPGAGVVPNAVDQLCRATPAPVRAGGRHARGARRM